MSAAQCAKALVAAFGTAVAAIVAAFGVESTVTKWATVVSATVGTLYAVYQTPNAPPPTGRRRVVDVPGPDEVAP